MFFSIPTYVVWCMLDIMHKWMTANWTFHETEDIIYKKWQAVQLLSAPEVYTHKEICCKKTW